MDDQQNLGRRVNSLETRMAEVVTALGGFKGTLEEIKSSLSNARPPMWMLVPAALTFISMLIGGVFFFTSVKGEIAQLQTTDKHHAQDAVRTERRLDELERARIRQLEAERDYWRQRAAKQG